MKRVQRSLKDTRRVAICHNPTHRGYLSVPSMQDHKCLEKSCPYFQRIQHDYWIMREQKKMESKIMRKIRALYTSNQISLDDFREAERVYRTNKSLFRTLYCSDSMFR